MSTAGQEIHRHNINTTNLSFFLARLDLKRQIQKAELCDYRGPLAYAQVISKTLVEKKQRPDHRLRRLFHAASAWTPRISFSSVSSNLCLARQQLGVLAAPLPTFGIKL